MELTRETKISLNQLNELINFVDLSKVMKQVQDLHGVPAKLGEVRRWQDGKLHIKKSSGWELLPNTTEYDKEVDEQSKHNNKGESIPVTSPQEYKDFVDCIFTKSDKLREERYRALSNTIRFPDILKTLAYQLGTKPGAMYIYKKQYQHINQKRKNAHSGQDLTKAEYYEIPNVIKNAKEAYIDLGHRNFFITFEDKQNKDKLNQIVFHKSISGNYIVTTCKINKNEPFDKSRIFRIEV